MEIDKILRKKYLTFSEQYIFKAYFVSCILSNKNKISNLYYIVKIQST